jgi:hypothetical protein
MEASAMDPHRLAELRSIELHRVVADRLPREPGLLADARARLASWSRDGTLHAAYAGEWLRLLALPLDDLRAFLVEDSERAAALRQVTPFAGAVPARDRWAIWKRVRAVAEGATP